MKRGEKSEMRLHSAIDVLISYQAYCISTGYSNTTLADAIYDKSVANAVTKYINQLQDSNANWLDEYGKEGARRIMRVIPYTTSNKHFADAFIKLNACLRKYYNKACVMSWHDLQVLIDAVSKRKENESHILKGNMKYCLVEDYQKNIINRAIQCSVHDIDTLSSLSDVDNELGVLYMWLFSGRCLINKGGIKSKLLTSEDFNKTVTREDVVFTKVIPQSWGNHPLNHYALDYRFDCLDMVSSLMFKLPCMCTPFEEVPADETRYNINKFIDDNIVLNGDVGVYAAVAQAVNKRAVRLGDLYVLSRYRESVGDYVLSVVIKDKAYVLNIIDEMLLSTGGIGIMPEEIMKSVVRTFDYTFEINKHHSAIKLADMLAVRKDCLGDNNGKQDRQEAM